MNYQLVINILKIWIGYSRIYIALFALLNFLLFKPKYHEMLGKHSKFMILLLYVIAIMAAITIVFEQKISGEIQNIWRQKTSYDLQSIRQGVDEIKGEKRKENNAILSNHPLSDIIRALIDIKMQLQDRSDYVDLLLNYFDDTAKIPNYPKSKWEETESIIYERYKMIIQNRYDDRKIHVYVNGKRETKKVYDVFREEREKFLDFKWGKKK